MKDFDEIEKCEEVLSDLVKQIQEETDPNKKKMLVETWSIMSKQHAELVKDEQEFMRKSEEDVDKERDYKMKHDQFIVQTAVAAAGVIIPLITTGACLFVKGRLFRNGLMFEMDGTPRSFFAKNEMNLNNVGKI